jgi:hypothetical protein
MPALCRNFLSFRALFRFERRIRKPVNSAAQKVRLADRVMRFRREGLPDGHGPAIRPRSLHREPVKVSKVILNQCLFSLASSRT